MLDPICNNHTIYFGGKSGKCKICEQADRIAELEGQVSVGIETHVEDRKRIAELEAMIESLTDSRDHARKQLRIYATEDLDYIRRGRFIEQIAELKADNKILRDKLEASDSYWAECEAKLDRVRGLLKVAKCPNSDCENGAIPHGPTPDGDWEWEQCQWCHELKSALGDEDGA